MHLCLYKKKMFLIYILYIYFICNFLYIYIYIIFLCISRDRFWFFKCLGAEGYICIYVRGCMWVYKGGWGCVYMKM